MKKCDDYSLKQTLKVLKLRHLLKWVYRSKDTSLIPALRQNIVWGSNYNILLIIYDQNACHNTILYFFLNFNLKSYYGIKEFSSNVE